MLNGEVRMRLISSAALIVMLATPAWAQDQPQGADTSGNDDSNSELVVT